MTKIIIIGGGPGGYVAAIRAAQLGASVTLIEKDTLGGTCLNVGCIPTKALLHSAELFRAVKHGAQIGVAAEPKLDFDQVQAHKSGITRKLVQGVTGLMRANRIEVVKGEAAFTGPKTLSVQTDKGGQTLEADKVIIATGSVPARPPIPGLDGERCIDSTGALNLGAVPKSLVIIGGGVIGVELASVYRAFGAEVTIIEMLDNILPMFDAGLIAPVQKQLEQEGVQIYTKSKVLSVENTAGGANVRVETANGEKTFAGEYVLVSIGRRVNTALLNLGAAGVQEDRGRITVNDRMETNVPGIYAIGDCIGKTMLAHVASAQGETAAENAMGHAAVYDEKTNPSCVYTDPELAMVGLTPAQAKQKGLDFEVATFPLAANGKALIENGGVGLIQMVVGKKYREILGVGIAGPRATDLIAQAGLAIRLEATTDELISTIHAHPTVGEAMREAALMADGRAVHAAPMRRGD